MTRTTLRRFLQAHLDDQFSFRDRIVGTQDLVNHYSVYLDAQILTDGRSTYFVTSRGLQPAPFYSQGDEPMREAA